MTRYAVLDVETTGGSPRRDKITDIAIYIYDGQRITDSFESLVNPECRIPPFITGLTGITNEMVEDAPCFYEIARKIIEITEDSVVVGHNVNFDYNFIKNEFRQLGYDYKRDTIDTVKLSRKLLPELSSHKLDILSEYLNIEITDRHRAAGDARATVDLFAWLRKKDILENRGLHVESTGFRGLHAGLRIESVKALPEETGVYYFYDDSGSLLYIGKSNNIYKRVHTHLNNENTGRAVEMKSKIADIDYEITGSELIALLKESHEIKVQKPRFNRAQRRSVSRYGLYVYSDERDYLQLRLLRTAETDETPVLCFTSMKSAKATLFRWTENFTLCQKLCGLYESAGACFGHGLGECKGACIGKEAPDEYNKRVKKLLRKYSVVESNLLLVERGRNDEELGVVQLQQGRYVGYGYINRVLAERQEEILDCIKPFPDNKDVQVIIRQYLDKYAKRLKILEY
ncbi:MAG: exonuclease domain-containing protein [Bacteroidota bacterium]